MTSTFRLSHAAEQDIVEILRRSQEEFGDDARQRYAALLVAAIRHAAEHRDGVGFRARPELGPDVVTWHLAQSAHRARGGAVRRPRHLLVCRWTQAGLVVGRVLHESMDPLRHLDETADWR
ncbi:type II toxin-antitoxin system RelE/ParE family toxin [Nocardioides sp. YIM 152588]|uniref:type II toxin-antitoxin system RelE/ParE family toxin n=1 Tax=Nocardioides sp. YIM 152588 TaxID=3158259 RepID=UPI0032E4FC9E